MEPSKHYTTAEFIDENGVAVVVPSTARIDFRIETVDSHRKDTANIKVYNLSPSSRTRIASDAIEVNLYAGYTDPPPLLFHGVVPDAVEQRSEDFTSWIVEVLAEDTKSAAQTEVVTRSYNDGTLLVTVLNDLVAAAGFAADVTNVGRERLAHPLPLLGPPAKLLRDVCDLHGYRYQIRNGTAIIVPTGDPINSVAVPVINSKTGLKGIPTARIERGQVVMTCRSRIDPRLRAGSLCVLETKATIGGRKASIPPKGTYWIKEAVFDASPGVFVVDITGRPYAP